MRARALRIANWPTKHLFAASFGCLLALSACGSSGTKTPTDGSADGLDAKTDTGTDGAKDSATDVATTDAANDGTDAAVDGVDAPNDVPTEAPATDASPDGSTDGADDGSHADAADGGASDGDASDSGSDVSDAAGPDGDAGALTCGAVAGSHLAFEFDTKNAEWVKSLKWRDSTATWTDNLVGFGGGPGCTSPYEFFGQAFAAPEGNAPYPVGGNTIASFTTCGTDQTIVSKSPDCGGGEQTPVTTVYHFYDGTKADQVRITRTIGFGADTPKSAGTSMRVYVPRLLLTSFSDVLIPNGAGTATATTSANSCGGDCFTSTGTTWNGKWFADVDPTSGRAMIVLRDPSLTSAVSLTINNDGASNTNLSSFVVLQPDDGWKAPLTETYYLCFADLTTWTQAARDAATLPAGCGP
jgi:hypothetical protein